MPDLVSITQEIEALPLNKQMELLAEAEGYESVPVDIDTFIDDPYYLGDSYGGIHESGDYEGLPKLYPFWREHLHDIFPNPFYSPYLEVVCGGAVGLGKTTLAKIGFLYDFYKILLLKNPHSKFGLIKTTLIMGAFITVTKKHSKTALMSEISELLETSAFFKSKLNPKPDGQLFPTKKLGVVAGSRFRDVVSMAIISAIMDEANETVVANQALDSYTQIRRRMVSRFMARGGDLPCRLWMCSSKKTENSFLEEHINSKRSDPKAKIIESSYWEVHKFRKIFQGYSNNPPYNIIDQTKFFKVFVGDNNYDPFIIDTKEIPKHIDSSRVLDVPIEVRSDFEKDLLKSLQDLAGVNTRSGYKLFKSKEEFIKAFIVPPAFTSDIIRLTVEGEDALKDFITDYLPSLSNKDQPRYIHLDGAEKHDRFGIGMAFSQGIKEIQRIDHFTGKVFTMQELVIMHDFGVAIEAYPGSEIPWEKIREFIVWLRDVLHFNIVLITGDTHQSFYMGQLLQKQNFNWKILSVDTSKDPYFTYKRAIAEGRVYSPKNQLLIKELLELEDTGKKIDHPSTEGSSKDLSDAICGSYFSCQENAHSSQLYSDRLIEDMKKHLEVNSFFNPKNGRFL